jgi:cholinesterase
MNSRGCPAIRGVTSISSSEDCLALNVWSVPQVGEKKKAVLVYVFGGGFSGGDSTDPSENGARFAKQQDVVIVSFNYRTNIFGFPGHPKLPNMNLGLMDIRMAIEWVRDNVEAFGGDASRITLFGESAGATAIDYYAFSYLKDPIVAGFIAQSGAAMITGPFTPPPEALRREAWYNTSKALGCGGEEKDFETVLCAQKKTVEEIKAAMPSLVGYPKYMETVGWFGPYRDEKLFFRDYHTLAKQGNFARKASSNLRMELFTGDKTNRSNSRSPS